MSNSQMQINLLDNTLNSSVSEIIEALKRGSAKELENLRQLDLSKAELAGANLSEASMIGVNFGGANLSSTNFS